MADAKIDKTTVTIDVDGTIEKFIATGEVVAFDGFLKVYHESTDDDDNSTEEAYLLPALRVNDRLERREIVSTERFSQGPLRYTEGQSGTEPKSGHRPSLYLCPHHLDHPAA